MPSARKKQEKKKSSHGRGRKPKKSEKKETKKLARKSPRKTSFSDSGKKKRTIRIEKEKGKKEKIYLTKGDLVQPFKVVIDQSSPLRTIRIYENADIDDFGDIFKETPKLVIEGVKEKDIFIGGKEPLYPEDALEGNAILVKNPKEKVKNTYIFIGRYLYEFETKAPIKEFVSSTMGRNDAPTPHAVDILSNVYLLDIDTIILLNVKKNIPKDILEKYHHDYNRYYIRDLVYVHGRDPPFEGIIAYYQINKETHEKNYYYLMFQAPSLDPNDDDDEEAKKRDESSKVEEFLVIHDPLTNTTINKKLTTKEKWDLMRRYAKHFHIEEIKIIKNFFEPEQK